MPSIGATWNGWCETNWSRARWWTSPGCGRATSRIASSSPGGKWGRGWSAAMRAGPRPRRSWRRRRACPGAARELRAQAAGVPELLRRLGHARLLHRLEERRPLRTRHALGPPALRQAAARGRNPLLSAVQGPADRRPAAAVQGPRPHPRVRPARGDQGDLRRRGRAGQGLRQLPGAGQPPGRRKDRSPLSACRFTKRR